MATSQDHSTERPTQSLGVEEALEEETGHLDFSLPPADGGKQAYLFLAGAFAVEALTWGKILLLDLDSAIRSNPSNNYFRSFVNAQGQPNELS